jgi:hypothetical protein
MRVPPDPTCASTQTTSALLGAHPTLASRREATRIRGATNAPGARRRRPGNFAYPHSIAPAAERLGRVRPALCAGDPERCPTARGEAPAVGRRHCVLPGQGELEALHDHHLLSCRQLHVSCDGVIEVIT